MGAARPCLASVVVPVEAYDVSEEFETHDKEAETAFGHDFDCCGHEIDECALPKYLSVAQLGHGLTCLPKAGFFKDSSLAIFDDEETQAMLVEPENRGFGGKLPMLHQADEVVEMPDLKFSE